MIFEPRRSILPPAQQELWARLEPAKDLRMVLYGGTAIALRLGHRKSVDFDFFSSLDLDKRRLHEKLPFLEGADVLEEDPRTFAVSVKMPSGAVKIAFFGGLKIGRVGDPELTNDGVLRVASSIDLLATKLKAILDRAEAKDYVDIAALLRSGLSLSVGLAAFRALFGGEPATALKAIGYFEDGDVHTISGADRLTLIEARDHARELPATKRVSASLAP